MARARNIKPGFCRNEDLAECSMTARLCFALLPMMADREGRLEDRPKRIKGDLFPFDSIEVEPLLAELDKHGLIARYAVDGLHLIQILAFRKHQNPHHREFPSTLPPHPGLRLDADGKYVKAEADPGLHGPKAEALPTCHDTEASAKPGLDPPSMPTETGTSPGKVVPSLGSSGPGPEKVVPSLGKAVPSRADSGFLIPDSLIPDSGFLIPDSSPLRVEASSNELARCQAGNPPGPPGPALALVEPKKGGPPDCPHGAILALWAEVLPAMPQHEADQWKGARADHLRARWREVATSKRWASVNDGLAYFRKLFGYVGQSRFLTGRVQPRDPGKPPFVVTLAWLVKPENWAKTIEGTYHQDAA